MFRRITIGIVVGTMTAFTLIAASYALGARINTTKSIPVGLYWTSAAPVTKGAYVLICPPPGVIFQEAKRRGYIAAGFCPGNLGMMMKRILAAENDTVTVADDGVSVNGNHLALSLPRRTDNVGRALPQFRVDAYQLRKGEILVMSDVSSTSFDGRYFGAINQSQIVAVVRPVFIW
jgi:conjugative transfer signal peptidase TraF